MALNYIWLALFLIGIITGTVRLIFFGDTETLPQMMDSTFDMSKKAFEMAIGLTGMLTFWMGLMKIGEDSGLVHKLAKLLSPILSKLFPDIPEGHPALGSIFMNMSANMLGLDNAATPIGLKAMQELQSINPQKDSASNSMIMFLVLNTSGLTLIPISIMAYRAANGASDPTDIFVPLLLTTLCSTIMGLICVSVIQKINLFCKEFILLFAGLFTFIGCIIFVISGMNNTEMQHFCRVLTSCLLFGTILLFLFSGIKKRINVYDSFIQGAKGGFNVAISLIPYIVAILVAIGVFQVSGCMGWLQDGISKVVSLCGFDTDFVNALPVAVMKPLSGPAARGMMIQTFASYGPDSFAGHLASVFQGSTDTTFYILAVYYGSVGIKKYRYSVKCGLLADLAGLLAAILISYAFFHY